MKILVVILILVGLPIVANAETVFWKSPWYGDGYQQREYEAQTIIFNSVLSIENDYLGFRLNKSISFRGSLGSGDHTDRLIVFRGIEQSRDRLIAACEQILEWNNIANVGKSSFIRTATIKGTSVDLVFVYRAYTRNDTIRHLSIAIGSETLTMSGKQTDSLGNNDEIETFLKGMIGALKSKIPDAIEKEKQKDAAMRSLSNSRDF